MVNIIFKVDNKIKQEYLNAKSATTAKTEVNIMRGADNFEDIISKPIYNMTYRELRGMLMMQFKNSSIKAVLKNVSILKTYIDFCINKNIVLHGDNRLAFFSPDEAKQIINKQVSLNRYITKEHLRDYQNILYNEQDKLLLELPFIGVRGRTIKEGTLEEIVNLSMDDVDEVSNIITLVQNNGYSRIIEVEASTIELIKETYEQKIYVENNGEETNNPRLSKPREIQINEVQKYVFRVPGKNKHEKFTPNLLNSRMRRLQKYLNNNYISYTSIFMSGMLNIAMDIYKEKGKVNKEDFLEICDRYNYGSGVPDRYWFNVKSLFNQYKEMLYETNAEEIDEQIKKDLTEDIDVPKNETEEVRNNRVKRYQKIIRILKKKYDYKCQLCGYRFRMDNGYYYCEAHHIKMLSKDGSQSPENVIILCANHHRIFHHASNTCIIEELIEGKRVIKIGEEEFLVKY